jgi:hypothetical protein
VTPIGAGALLNLADKALDARPPQHESL